MTTLQRIDVAMTPPHRVLAQLRRWRLVVYLLLLLLAGVLATLARGAPSPVARTVTAAATVSGD